MLFFPMHGRRRYIPGAVRVRRAVRGLERAAHDQRIFHLWLHPMNLADESDAMFAALRSAFNRMSELRAAGELAVMSMGSLVLAVQHQVPDRESSAAGQS
jgi:hypothetical protein